MPARSCRLHLKDARQAGRIGAAQNILGILSLPWSVSVTWIETGVRNMLLQNKTAIIYGAGARSAVR